MRIISKFFDYYDKGMSYGMDPNMVFVRKTESISFDKTNSLINSNDLFKFVADFSPFDVIGFCGKMFPVYRDFTDTRNCKKVLNSEQGLKHTTWYLSGSTYRPFYSFEELENNYDRAHSAYAVQRIFELREYSYAKHSIAKYREIDNYIGKTISDDIFRKYNSPIIHCSLYPHDSLITITINPLLSNFNFVTKYDAVSAFQEISMYIGNNLVRQIDPTTNFSDDLKRDIAGFDNWSFRKHKKDRK